MRRRWRPGRSAAGLQTVGNTPQFTLGQAACSWRQSQPLARVGRSATELSSAEPGCPGPWAGGRVGHQGPQATVVGRGGRGCAATACPPQADPHPHPAHAVLPGGQMSPGAPAKHPQQTRHMTAPVLGQDGFVLWLWGHPRKKADSKGIPDVGEGAGPWPSLDLTRAPGRTGVTSKYWGLAR